MIGRTLNHYRIEEKIGAGGMGEVYRATDSKLGREVAIKVLPDAFAKDPERLARFDQEARLLASLNHPNIAAIHGLEESDGVRFLVLELVPGDTLAERISQGPIPVDEALTLCRQIAEALEAAHERGIIHRDLKPANVKVTPDGKVKVLDFGLAKAFQTDSSAAVDLSQSPTASYRATSDGVILGTVAYMSPEQARGKPVDKRTDIWSFGCVLYEVLTGTTPFGGDTMTDVLAAIVRAEPDWDALATKVSPGLVGITKRCLHKDLRERLHSAGDIGLTLKQLAEEDATLESAGTIVAPPQDAAGHHISMRLAAGLLLGVAVVAAGLSWMLRSEPGAEPQRRFSISLTEGTFLPAGVGTDLAISRDGNTIVYLADDLDSQRLYVRGINDFEARPLPGTEGSSQPFLSPDGEWIGFDLDGGIKKLSLSSLELHPLCDSCDWGSWGDDGNVYFTRNSALWRIRATGGQPELVAEPRPGEGIPALIRSHVLPGSKVLLFEIGLVTFSGVGALSLQTGEILRISVDGSDPFYSATGHILFPRRNTLFAVPFDAERFEVTGREMHVLQGVRVENAGALQAAISSNGLLIYAPSGRTMGTQLTWIDRQGGREAVSDQWRLFTAPRISPSGDQITTVINDGGKTDIWVVDVHSGGMVPLTTTGTASAPVWTPDGTHVTFAQGFSGPFSIRSVSADGSGSEETLLVSDYRILPGGWHPDGNLLVFDGQTKENDDLFIFDASAMTATPLLDSDAAEDSAALSPDGRRLAYVSDKTGINEVYVRPFPGPGPEVPVSIGRGENPMWSHDGSELFYRDARWYSSAAIDGLRVTKRHKTLKAVFFWSAPLRAHADVHPDGQRFLVLHKNEDQTRPGINVVINWFEELNRLAPAERD